MALTAGKILVASDGTHARDSGITAAAGGTTIAASAADGSGVTPVSATFGLAITFNNEAGGEVNFWNQTNASADGQGFYFYQKIDATTYFPLAYLYAGGGGNNTSLEIHSPAGSVLNFFVYDNHPYAEISTDKDYFTFSSVMLIKSMSFAELPASPVDFMIVGITDSTTAVWGAAITIGGGSEKVIACYIGAWTVMGKG